MKLTLDVEDPHHQLTSGMFVRTKIMLQRKSQAVLVPKNAVVRDNGDMFVFLISDSGLAERRKLVTGLENARFLEIAEGIKAGDRLIVVGQHGLENNAPVYLVDDSAVTPEPEAQDNPVSTS